MIDSIVLHKFPVGLSVQEASATKNGSTHTKAATELPTTTICHKYNEVVVCNNLLLQPSQLPPPSLTKILSPPLPVSRLEQEKPMFDISTMV